MMAGPLATDQPLIEGGVASVNWFNGRLVTGEDLTREQQAAELNRLRLGRVIGRGVACGLSVSAATSSSSARPVLRIEPGLAVNSHGQVLELASSVELALTRDRTGTRAADLIFRDCSPVQPGTYSAGAGVYLLTVAPAVTGVGRARVSGFGNSESGCSVAFSVSGVQFHLLQVALPREVVATESLLRNRLAHAMAGTDDQARRAVAAFPLGSSNRVDGLLNQLAAAGGLGPQEVPLAALHWTATRGIRFVDMWAVRRRITEPDLYQMLPGHLPDSASSDAQALLCQFQDQLADLLAAGPLPAGASAAGQFSYLPPVGVVPIASAGRPVGFNPELFLGSQGSNELATIDAAAVRELVWRSFDHTPIAVGGPERVQRYVIWENELAWASGAGQRVMLFARETLPYLGRARVGVARFNRSRFAPTVI